jgi:hypothetical protein
MTQPDQRDAIILVLGIATDLVIPEPDFVIKQRKGKNVVDERLEFSGGLGYTESLSWRNASRLVCAEKHFLSNTTYMGKHLLQ